MGRKRKSELISEDDSIGVVDLTEGHGIEDDASLMFPQRESDRKSGFAANIHISCGFCRYGHLKCDLQRPVCGECPRRSASNRLHNCVYPRGCPDLSSSATSKATGLAERPNVDEVEVEVVDLESDNDNDKEDNEGKEYEVEEILEQRRNKTIIQYLVKWRGYPDRYNTWEPVKSLRKSKGLIKDFNAVGKMKAHPLLTKKASTLQQIDRQSAARSGPPTPHSKTPAKIRSSRPVITSPGLLLSPDKSPKRSPEDVNCVLACRESPSNNEYEYLVEWKGRAPQQRSWETESGFSNHKRIVQYYHIGYPHVTNTSNESPVLTPSKQVWFSEDTHCIHSSRRMGPDEDHNTW